MTRREIIQRVVGLEDPPRVGLSFAEFDWGTKRGGLILGSYPYDVLAEHNRAVLDYFRTENAGAVP